MVWFCPSLAGVITRRGGRIHFNSTLRYSTKRSPATKFPTNLAERRGITKSFGVMSLRSRPAKFGPEFRPLSVGKRLERLHQLNQQVPRLQDGIPGYRRCRLKS
jgi:hypothetical protein